MKKTKIILLTLLGLMFDIMVVVISGAVVGDSDGFYTKRLEEEMTLFDPATEASKIFALKVSRLIYIVSAKLPYVEVAACVLAIVGMLLYLTKGPQSKAGLCYKLAFWLPLLLVLPLLVAAPVASSLTRRQGVSEFVFIGVVGLVIWVFISGIAFLGASSSIQQEGA